jgi:phage protein D
MLLVRLQDQSNREYRIVTDSILSFKYTDAERKTDTVKLTVDNSDLTQFDDPAWRKGGRIRVSWGYPGAMAPERTCIITSVKGFRELSIEANAESVLMNLVTRQRVFEGKKISEIAEQIASEYGYGSDVQHIDDTMDREEIITQANLTDAQFLRQRASDVGFEFYVDFDGFHFHERRLGEPPVRALTYFIDGDQGDFVEDPTIDNDVTARPGRVRTRGRNPRTRSDITQSADNNSDDNRQTLTHMVDVIDSETRTTTTVRRRRPPDQSERRLGSEQTVPTADANNNTARRRARGRFRRAQQVAVKMKAKIIGDPVLLAKTIVQVRGMGQRLSVKYYLQEVTHDLSPSGYICNLTMVSDGHGGHSTRSRQARGLSMLNVQQTRNRRGRNQEVEDNITSALDASRSTGDNQSRVVLESAQEIYRRNGNRSASDVSRLLGSVANNTNADSEVRQSSLNASRILAQQGSETPSGGRVNNNEPREQDQTSLDPVDSIDPETRETTTVYRQTPGRGTNDRRSTSGRGQ